jgi:hypothetical protein
MVYTIPKRNESTVKAEYQVLPSKNNEVVPQAPMADMPDSARVRAAGEAGGR